VQHIVIVGIIYAIALIIKVRDRNSFTIGCFV